MMRIVPILVVFALSSVARAQPGRPPQLQDVGVEERVGERVALDAVFTDTTGRRIALSALLDGRPIVLVLTYLKCKTLCSLVLHGVIEAVRALPLEVGRDYQIVFVSIDSRETASQAHERRREIVAQFRRDTNAFTYLTGSERAIRRLADSVGFRYKVDARTEQIAHAAVIFVLTPEGRISRYLHGVQFPADELAAALRAAAAGDVTSSKVAAAVLDCFRFDPALRAHRDQIDLYLRIGGAAVMIALTSSIALLFQWERRRRRST